jgi:osmotically-inducible protein OsmY
VWRPSTQRSLLLLTTCLAAAVFMPPGLSPDAQVRRRVLRQLQSNSATQHLSLDVHVSGAVATVSGGIRDRAEQVRALAVVRHSEGVLDVIDNLTISDDVITQNVLRVFRDDPSVSGIPVTVTSTGGEVTLQSNQTDEAQRRYLVQLAATVDGVVHVVDAMK